MITQSEAKTLIHNLLEDQAEMLGELLFSHEVSDDFVWAVVRGLDLLRIRTIKQLELQVSRHGDDELEDMQLKLHPAIETFLVNLRLV